MFLVMMAVAGAKEATIAGRTAIRVLKQHMAQEPIFDADSSRTEELSAATMRTTRDMSLRSGFVHGKILCWGRLSYNAWRSHGQRLPSFVLKPLCHADLAARLPHLVVLVRKSKQVARCYHQNKHSGNSTRPEPPRRQVSFDKRPHEIDSKPESEEPRQDVDAETKGP